MPPFSCIIRLSYFDLHLILLLLGSGNSDVAINEAGSDVLSIGIQLRHYHIDQPHKTSAPAFVRTALFSFPAAPGMMHSHFSIGNLFRLSYV